VAVQTIDYQTAILTVLLEVRYTRSRLRAHPLGAPFVGTFDALRDECLAALQEDLHLREAQMDAQATIDIANDTLNVLCTRFSRTILSITGENREHGLYLLFFKGKDLTAFKRPKLGEKRDNMGDWVTPSQSGEYPELQALAPELVTSLDAADQAVAARSEAQRLRAEFRDIGNRRKLVDHVNSVRKSTYGALASIAHAQTGLPPGFADHFFRKESSKPRASDSQEPDTMEEALARVEELREALAEAEALVVDLEAAAQAEVVAAQDRSAKEVEIARLDADMAAMAARRASLAAEVEAV